MMRVHALDNETIYCSHKISPFLKTRFYFEILTNDPKISFGFVGNKDKWDLI